jgi:hypothetical protein
LKFREHRSTLEESLETEVELDGYFGLLAYLNARPHLPSGFGVAVKPYAMEPDGETFVVMASQVGVLGFARGDPNAATLTHITVDTGHTRESPRAEVDDLIIETLRGLVREGYGTIGGLAVEISVPRSAGFASFSIAPTPNSTPVVGCCLVWDARFSRSRWHTIIEPLPLPTPTVPWLAAELHASAADLAPEVLIAIGDAERCIAWAILAELGETLTELMDGGRAI